MALLHPGDDRAGEFGTGLCEAVGAEGAGTDPVRIVCNAVWRKSPRDVALVVDHVHYVGANSSGAELLRRLLKELPENGHLVLASRGEVPLATTRLIAAGDAATIDEKELAFDVAESGASLAMRGAPSIDGEWAGWPAILELAATTGETKVGAFLWEEVLSALPEQRRRNLARLACLDWVDAGRIEAFTGSSGEAATFATDLPLTSFEANGAVRLHGRWQPALAALDPAWTDAEFVGALGHLVEAGHYREAVGLCLSTKRNDFIAKVIAALVADWLFVSPATLETVVAMIPQPARSAPTGQLLEGLYRMRSDPARARPYLEAAQRGLAASGDEEAEFAALSGLTMLAFWQVDVSGMGRIYERVSQLRLPQAEAGMKLLESFQATSQCQPDLALELIDEARRLYPNFGGQDAVNAALACLDAGRSDRAIAEVAAALPHVPEMAMAALEAVRFDALWMNGMIGAKELAPFDEGLPSEDDMHVHNLAIFLAVLGFQNATAGRIDVARHHSNRAAALDTRSLGPRAAMALAVSRMAVQAAEGNEEAARKIIETCFDQVPAESILNRQMLRGAPLASILSPRIRRDLQGWKIGPCFQLGLAAADALLALRDEGDFDAAAALDWHQPRRFGVFPTPSLRLELAIGASAGGNTEAARLCEEFSVDHRIELRRLAKSSSSAMANAAGELLRRVPGRPAGRLEIRVLGSLELVRDGKVIEDPGLRRERVQAIVHYLVARRACRREESGVAVWPDLDERSVANHLRVNLHHVRHILEPDCQPREPSFFVPQSGDELALRSGDGLEIDVDRFEEHLAQAESADTSGSPGLALEHYESALSLYRGEYLRGSLGSDWGVHDRTRLSSAFVRGALRAAALRLGHSDLDAALRWTRRALEIDPLAEPGYRLQAIIYLRREDRSAARSALLDGFKALDEGGLVPDDETLRIARRLGIENSRKLTRSAQSAPELMHKPVMA